jgi:single-strand DNA-binding protein
MSVGYSSIALLGYLGQDPQSIQSTSGAKGARFSLAVNRVWTDDSGKRREETDWFTVVAWERLAENCLEHLSTGRLVFVVGRPRMQRWIEKKTRKREQVQVLAEQVIFLDKPESEENAEE